MVSTYPLCISFLVHVFLRIVWVLPTHHVIFGFIGSRVCVEHSASINVLIKVEGSACAWNSRLPALVCAPLEIHTFPSLKIYAFHAIRTKVKGTGPIVELWPVLGVATIFLYAATVAVVPSTCDRIVAATITLSVSHFFRVVHMTIWVAPDATVPVIPPANLCVEHPCIAVTIAYLRGVADSAIGVPLVQDVFFSWLFSLAVSTIPFA